MRHAAPALPPRPVLRRACSHARAAACACVLTRRAVRRAQDMEPEEYESTKADTLKQLEEFHGSLSRLMARSGARMRCFRAGGALQHGARARRR